MHEGSQRVVELAEGRADGSVEADAVRAAEQASQRAARLDAVATNAVAAVSWFTDDDISRGVSMIAGNVACCVAMKKVPGRRRTAEWEAFKDAEEAEQAGLFREMTGNPFRPATADPAWLAWRDGAVVKLAQAAYEERLLPAGELDPTRLAILADALEDGGCTDADILAHLRGPGPHVRGCWVIDLLLGKS
jgi:hypothetical protein